MHDKRALLAQFNSIKSARQYERRNTYKDQEFMLLIRMNGKYEPAIFLDRNIYSLFLLQLKAQELQTRYEVLKASIPITSFCINYMI